MSEDATVSRRRLLAAGAGVVGAGVGLAGCSSLTGPDRVDARRIRPEGTGHQVAWVYPAAATTATAPDDGSGGTDSGGTDGDSDGGGTGADGGGDGAGANPDDDGPPDDGGGGVTDGPSADLDDGIGYAAVRLDLFPDADPVGPLVEFRLNSTVWDVAAGREYGGYVADRFRFGLDLPGTTYRALVSPPNWPAVTVSHGPDDGLRVAAPEVGTAGTIVVGGRLIPETVPDQVECSFAVQVSRTAPVGRTVRAGDRTILEFDADDRGTDSG